MKLYIRKNELLRDIFMKFFIFITIFYTFYISLTNAARLPGTPTTIITIIVILGMLLTNKVTLHFMDLTVFFSLLVLSMINIWAFNVESSSYINTFLLCFLPMILAGGIIDFEKYHEYIYRVSCVYIVVLFIYVVNSYIGTLNLYSTDSVDIMGFAYYSIPAILIITYNYFRNKGTINLLFLILGALYLLICGTRGPILCLLVFGIFCVSMELKNGNVVIKLRIIVLLIIALVILINIKTIAIMLYPIFKKKGFSTRFITSLINDNSLGDLSGRDSLYEVMIQRIKAHPIIGGGLIEERVALRGYAHNLVLEMLNAFGIPIGLVLVTALFLLIIYSFVKTKSITYKYYIAAFACVPLVKLMFSSSFLQESSLFILIGICFSAMRKRSILYE